MLTAVGDFTLSPQVTWVLETVSTNRLSCLYVALPLLGGRKGWIGVAGELLLTSVSFRT